MEKHSEMIDFKEKNLTIPIGIVKQINTIKYVDKEYIENQLKDIKNNRDRIFIKFLWTTGIRITEAISIKKKDILFDQNIIIIKWLKKRKELSRTIPLHKSLKEILILYTAKMNLNDKLFNFTRQRAFHITKKNLGISPHVFRHSFAVHYLKQGGRLNDLKKLLGHSNINITIIYSELTQTELTEEVNKIDF